MAKMAAYGLLDFWPWKRKQTSSVRFPIEAHTRPEGKSDYIIELKMRYQGNFDPI